MICAVASLDMVPMILSKYQIKFIAFKQYSHRTSNMAEASEALTTPQENELAMLTHSIIEWRRLKEKNDSWKQEMREATTNMKALEEIIVRVMKSHNIGALDLKNSGGRVLFKKSKRQTGMGQKTMEKLIGEYLESVEEAQNVMKYIQDHREVVIKESIQYEKI
jgi:hypothetical protein